MIVCPFCGLATESPHETQATCIEALHSEISRVRDILDKMKDEEPAARPALRVTAEHPPLSKTQPH